MNEIIIIVHCQLAVLELVRIVMAIRKIGYTLKDMEVRPIPENSVHIIFRRSYEKPKG